MLTTILEGSNLTLESIMAECPIRRLGIIIRKEGLPLYAYFFAEGGDSLFCEMVNIKVLFTKKDLKGIIKIEFLSIQ
jgi:hypothetical protein